MRLELCLLTLSDPQMKGAIYVQSIIVYSILSGLPERTKSLRPFPPSLYVSHVSGVVLGKSQSTKNGWCVGFSLTSSAIKHS